MRESANPARAAPTCALYLCGDGFLAHTTPSPTQTRRRRRPAANSARQNIEISEHSESLIVNELLPQMPLYSC